MTSALPEFEGCLRSKLTANASGSRRVLGEGVESLGFQLSCGGVLIPFGRQDEMVWDDHSIHIWYGNGNQAIIRGADIAMLAVKMVRPVTISEASAPMTFANTQVPVRDLVRALQQGKTVNAFKAANPSIPRSEIDAVLDRFWESLE